MKKQNTFFTKALAITCGLAFIFAMSAVRFNTAGATAIAQPNAVIAAVNPDQPDVTATAPNPDMAINQQTFNWTQGNTAGIAAFNTVTTTNQENTAFGRHRAVGTNGFSMMNQKTTSAGGNPAACAGNFTGENVANMNYTTFGVGRGAPNVNTVNQNFTMASNANMAVQSGFNNSAGTNTAGNFNITGVGSPGASTFNTNA